MNSSFLADLPKPHALTQNLTLIENIPKKMTAVHSFLTNSIEWPFWN